MFVVVKQHQDTYDRFRKKILQSFREIQDRLQKKKLEKNRHCKFVFDIVQRIVDLQRELTFHSIPSMCIIQARKKTHTPLF